MAFDYDPPAHEFFVSDYGTAATTVTYTLRPASVGATTASTIRVRPTIKPRDWPLYGIPAPGMTRSAWHRERRAPTPLVLGCARSQEARPFVPRVSVERRHRSSLRRFA